MTGSAVSSFDTFVPELYSHFHKQTNKQANMKYPLFIWQKIYLERLELDVCVLYPFFHSYNCLPSFLIWLLITHLHFFPELVKTLRFDHNIVLNENANIHQWDPGWGSSTKMQRSLAVSSSCSDSSKNLIPTPQVLFTTIWKVPMLEKRQRITKLWECSLMWMSAINKLISCV